MTAQEAKEHFLKLALQHGVDRSAVEQVFGNEKFLGDLGNGYTRHSEYSRALDETRDLKSAVDQYAARLAQYDNWYTQTALPTINQASQAINTLARYEAAGIQLNGQSNGQQQAVAAAATQSGLTEKQVQDLLDKQLGQRDRAYTSMAKILNKFSIRHFKDYGEELDVDAVEGLMDKNGLTIDQAYSEFTKPRREEKDKLERKAWEDKTRSELEKDIRSKHSLPVSARPKESLSDLWSKKPAEGKTPNQTAKEAFFDGWNESGNDQVA